MSKPIKTSFFALCFADNSFKTQTFAFYLFIIELSAFLCLLSIFGKHFFGGLIMLFLNFKAKWESSGSKYGILFLSMCLTVLLRIRTHLESFQLLKVHWHEMVIVFEFKIFTLNPLVLIKNGFWVKYFFNLFFC